MTDIKTIAKLALATAIASVSTGAMAAKAPNYVACYGVSKQGPNVPLLISKGDCEKLAGAKVQALTPAQKAETATMKPYTASDYVACLGVAAVAKNDCATKTSACGGTSSVARDPNAWIAIPKGVCTQVKGGVVGDFNTKKS